MQGSDLKERLRRHEGVGAALAHDRGQTGRFVCAIMDEAASEIERLEADNAGLASLIAEVTSERDFAQRAIADHRGDAKTYLEALVIERARAEAAEAQRDKLKEAAGRYFTRYCQDEADDVENCVCGQEQHEDAKALAEALASMEGEK